MVQEAAHQRPDALANLTLFLPSFPVVASAPSDHKQTVKDALNKIQETIKQYTSRKGRRKTAQDGHNGGRASDWLDIEGRRTLNDG